jgi:hypothetical protein
MTKKNTTYKAEHRLDSIESSDDDVLLSRIYNRQWVIKSTLYMSYVKTQTVPMKA